MPVLCGISRINGQRAASLVQSRWASILALIEPNEAQDAPSLSSLRILSAAAQIDDSSLDVLVTGSSAQSLADSVLQQMPTSIRAGRIFICAQEELNGGLSERMAPLICHLIQREKFTHVIAAHTAWGKNIIPRIGGILDVQPITDILKIYPKNKYLRPIYAGNALSTVCSLDALQLLTLRSTAYDLAKSDGGGSNAEKIVFNMELQSLSLSSVVQRSTSSVRESGPELTSAKYVIAGGRGLKSADNFKLLDDLAEALGRKQTAVGASRAAVDAGFAPNDRQIGQTGKIVAPEMYIAVGISGAIQHLAGMKDSKVIVAINKDGDSPIFQTADYGLVDDLFKVLPELTKAIKSK